MRTVGLSILLLAAASACCFAQQWEFGATGGGGFLGNVSASGPAGSATVGFQSGAAVGGFFGQNLYSHFSGELRYMWLNNNLHIRSGSQEATFSGETHVLHYDLLVHTNRKGSKVQGFVAMGAGIKIFRGTGTPAAYQPLYQFGFMTHTQEVKPMASVGAGMRFMLSNRVSLRTEFRDYISAFPTQVIAPSSPGVKYGSVLHDLVPMVGISYEF